MKAPKATSPFRLSSLLRLQKDPNLALQLFRNPNPNPQKPQKLFRYSLRSYDLIITKLAQAKMFDEMEQILQQLKQETRFSPPEVIFCNVIQSYGRARLPTRALRMFDDIPSFGCPRSVKSYNSLLKVLVDCKEFEKMKEVFKGGDRYGKPDAVSYNILILACCRSGYLDEAREVFDEMQRNGCQPSVVTLSTLICGLCRNSKLKEAFKLKEDMRRAYKLLPNSHIYASLISGFCKVGDLSMAFRLKEEMVKKKLQCDSAVFAALISGLFRAGRKDDINKVLEEMKESECKPSTVTYNALINGFCKEGDFEKAYEILDEMVENGCKTDVLSYNAIVFGLCKEGKWSNAIELFEDMPRRGCVPDVVTYRILFDGLCEAMQFKEAASILDEMIFKGFSPQPASVNNFVHRLCQEGNLEILWTVFASLAKENIIDANAWRMLVTTVCGTEELACAPQLDNLMIL